MFTGVTVTGGEDDMYFEQGRGEGVFIFGHTGDDIWGEALGRHLGRGRSPGDPGCVAHGALGLGKVVQGVAGVHGQGQGGMDDDRRAGAQRGGQQRLVSKKHLEALRGYPRDGVWPSVTKGTPWRGLWRKMMDGTSDVGNKVQYNWR